MRIIVEDLVQASQSRHRCHRRWFQTRPHKQAPAGGTACGPPWGGERKGGFYQVFGCIWSQGAFIFPTQRVEVTHQPLSGVETAYGSRQQTNKDGSRSDRRHLLQQHQPYLSLYCVQNTLGLVCQPRTSRGLAAMELWVQDGRMWGEDGLYAFSSGCGFLRRQTVLLPLQTHFPTTVSQMILSDCFSIWAMHNTRAGIHLQSVFSFFSSGNGNELVLSCRTHMDSVCLFWHSKTNHSTVLTKGSPWRASCRKEGCCLSLPSVWWAVCLTDPSRGKISQILLRS